MCYTTLHNCFLYHCYTYIIKNYYYYHRQYWKLYHNSVLHQKDKAMKFGIIIVMITISIDHYECGDGPCVREKEKAREFHQLYYPLCFSPVCLCLNLLNANSIRSGRFRIILLIFRIIEFSWMLLICAKMLQVLFVIEPKSLWCVIKCYMDYYNWAKWCYSVE